MMARMRRSSGPGETAQVGWVPAGVCSAHLMLLCAGAVLLFRHSRPHPGPEYLALLALGALAIAAVPWFGSRGARRNWAGWALAALIAGSVGAVGATSGSRRLALLALSELAVGCALNAVGVTVMLRCVQSTWERISARFAIACAVGGFGLIWVLSSAIHGPKGASFPTILALSSTIAVALCALALEPLVHQGPRDRMASTVRRLVGGAWLGVAAIAAASLAGAAAGLLAWSPAGRVSHGALVAAERAGRLGWLHALPLIGMVLVVFVRRTELVGLATLSAGRRWLGLTLAAGLSLGAGRYVLAQERTRVAAEADAACALAPAAPPPPTSVAAGLASIAPELPSIGVAGSAPQGSASPTSSADTDPGAGAVISVASLQASGVLEAGVSTPIDRRRNLLERCAERGGLHEAATLSVRIVVGVEGGAASVTPTGGDLTGTPVGDCLMRAFYHMGFPPPLSKPATVALTLRVAPTR